MLDDEWRHGGSDDDLARIIREGSTANGMPAFGAAFNEQQIRAMVIYIREQRELDRRAGSRPVVPPALPGRIETGSHALKVEVIAEDLDYPWGLAFLPDGRLLVTERAGRLRILEAGKLGPPIGGLPPVWVKQDGGLLDVALHPDYSRNGWLYLAFTERGGELPESSTTRAIRGRLEDGELVAQQDLFRAPPELYWQDNTHYGLRFLFDGQGHVFFSLGDRGRDPLGQDLSSPYGKLHRVREDGSVPQDNPFMGRKDAIATIWSYGHRNQQGLAIDPVSGLLWSTEHGPRGGDELNIIRKGHNYGWPVVTHGMNHDGTAITEHTARDGMEQPILQWTPSIAPGAMLFYKGDAFPRWKNSLLVASLAGQQLLRFELNGEEVTHEEVIWKGYGRIRNLIEAPDGSLYIALERPGKLIRLARGD